MNIAQGVCHEKEIYIDFPERLVFAVPVGM
jgi:hypothetical protein